MEENEELKNENIEEREEETAVALVQDFGAMQHASKTKANIYTNITDPKKIFNLNSHVDHIINDCEGEMIRVKEVLIKRFEKPMKEPEVDLETGEIIKDKEISMCCILIDDRGESYVTGSKVFTIQMSQYINMFGIAPEGFEIKIIKKQQERGKSLGFELV